jgi:hypothetical protein
MKMSTFEIKEFWRGYCSRRKVDPQLVAQGEAEIERDPERWADETMDTLLALVKSNRPS